MKQGFHSDARGLAFNVKVYTLPDVEGATDAQLQQAEEMTRERFWQDADELAKQHGFTGVFSAGRMGGWCYPVQGRHAVTAEDLEESDELRARWDAFADDLENRLKEVRGDFAQDVAQVMDEDREAKAREAVETPRRIAADFLTLCESQPGEFWQRLAGSVRKAQTML